MNTVVRVRRSYSPGIIPQPGQLSEGQFAINITDKLLYVGDNKGGVVDLNYTAGGGITLTNKQFSLANIVVAGTYTKSTVNAKGQVIAGANLDSTDIVSALGYTPVSNTGGSLSGTLTLTSGTVTGLPQPNAASDAAPKSYVDNLINGVAWKTEAAVATTINIVLSGLQTTDGYAIQAGDRVLVKNQTVAAANGVYVAAAGAWTRAADTTTGVQLLGMAILVLNGTTQGVSQWVNNNTTSITVGITGVTYVQLQVAGAVTLGANQVWSGTQTHTGLSTSPALRVTNATEILNIVAVGPSAVQPLYVSSGAVQFYTVASTANWTLNLTWSPGTSMNAAMTIGDSITVAMMVTQGATPFLASAIQIDGVNITPKWQGGTAPPSGNANGIDVYTFTAIKTASATYVLLGALTQYK